MRRDLEGKRQAGYLFDARFHASPDVTGRTELRQCGSDSAQSGRSRAGVLTVCHRSVMGDLLGAEPLWWTGCRGKPGFGQRGDNGGMKQGPDHRSFMRGFERSSWSGLLVLGLFWALALVVNDPQSINLVLFAALLWFGHLGAALLSGRPRWWLHGTASVVAFVLVVLVAPALMDTPYPPSTVE